MKHDDLKQIAKLLDDTLEEKLDKKLDEKLAPIHKTLSEHGKILKSHGRQLQSIKKTQDVMLKVLDREQMKQAHRLKKVEVHLGLSSAV